jgi:glycosyltransferase involved in cell wall biosynthesis
MRDFEHILIDGASTDGTREYLEGLGDSVRWISEPDRGIADALNKGVALARGSYVLVLQADDEFVNSESLARAAAYLNAEIDILACDILFGDRDSVRHVRVRFPQHRLKFKPLRHQGVFVQRRLFAEIGEFDDTYDVCMDYDFIMRAYRAGARIASARVLLSRMADGGISSRRDWSSLRTRFAEERRVHLAHCPSHAMRAIYAIYWPSYLCYRRLRALLTPLYRRE